MKINPRFLLALLAASSLSAAPLVKPTAVHAKPESASPALAVLSAGTEPTVSASTAAPAGWVAVELPGPHEAYVQNKDILKSLDVRPGASLYLAPKVDAPVLTTMAKGDAAEITGLHGRWTQVRLKRTVIGYINPDENASPVTAAPAAATVNRTTNAALNPPLAGNPSPAAASRSTPPPAPVATQQAAQAQTGGSGTVVAGPADNSAIAVPRLFEGTFLAAKRFLAYKPYDYQLNDRGGQRYAFLDVSHLMKTEDINHFLDHTVVIYGTAKPIPNTKDIVIVVESLQLH